MSVITHCIPVAITTFFNQVLEKNGNSVTITASDTAIPTTTVPPVNVNGSSPPPTTDSKDRTQRLNKLTK